MTIRKTSLRGQCGFSLIEVLIALFVLLLGVLGVAGLTVQSQRAGMESYQRNQALFLVQDMVGRINANRAVVASCYLTNGLSPAYLGNGAGTIPACAAGTSAQNAMAQQDLQQWSELLKGATETDSGGGKVGASIGARGCVVSLGTGLYLVSVAWQGLSATQAPPAGLTCGSGLYGSEAQRRVISIPVRIANLT